MAIKGRFPAIRPSLDLNFAKTKRLDPRITFTRASSGTYVGRDGLIKTAGVNEARFDHNPTTGESLGLLVEEQRTNLLLRSEEFDNAAWIKGVGVSVAPNTTISPVGTLTADTVTADSGISILQNVNSVVGTSYTNSVYAKAGTATSIMFRDDTGAGRHIVFNPSTGVITATVGTFVSTPVSQFLGDGWYRYSMTYVADTTSVRGLIRPNSAGSAQTFIVWGAQIEVGAFPTSYIPTTTAAATRSADVASITGTNFSSWYRQDEGTIWANGTAPNKSVTGFRTRGFLSINNGTQNESMLMGHGATEGSYRGSLFVDNVNQFAINAQQTLINVFTASDNYIAKTCIAYKANDLIQSADGRLTSPVSSASLPVTDRMNIGDSLTVDGYLNGTIRRLTYWPQRLSNATLQALTS